ncbi:MAG: hypothetical protein MN733_22320 [Nitrososphaera sp.]|nr:hypothetical protein [Nitrososphaera sp.]
MRIPGRPSYTYLHAGIVILTISGAFSLYLNFEGVRCLTAINTAGGVLSEQALEELERNCFIITNSYVYSLFGVVAGVVLIAIWVRRKRKVRHDS